MLQDSLDLRISPVEGKWRDVGRPEDLLAANAAPVPLLPKPTDDSNEYGAADHENTADTHHIAHTPVKEVPTRKSPDQITATPVTHPTIASEMLSSLSQVAASTFEMPASVRDALPAGTKQMHSSIEVLQHLEIRLRSQESRKEPTDGREYHRY